MPIYVYKCDRCGESLEVQRKIAEMDHPQECPVCRAEDLCRILMKRQIAAPARSFPGAGSWRGT